jgi:hypothetical protein
VTLGEWITHLVANAMKATSFGAATVVTALPQGLAAGYGSYIVGQAAKYYLEHGASWGDTGPKNVVRPHPRECREGFHHGEAPGRGLAEDPRRTRLGDSDCGSRIGFHRQVRGAECRLRNGVPVDARSGTTRTAARSVVGKVEVIDAPPDQLVEADAYLLVCDKDLTESEMAHLRNMRGRPVAIVLNKSDTYDAAQLDGLLNHIRNRVRGLVQPERVLACAADPVRIVHRERADGTLSEHVVPAQADVAAILEAVQELITAAGSSVRVRSRELAGRFANAIKNQWIVALCVCCAAGASAKEPARPKIVGVSHLAVYSKDLGPKPRVLPRLPRPRARYYRQNRVFPDQWPSVLEGLARRRRRLGPTQPHLTPNRRRERDASIPDCSRSCRA